MCVCMCQERERDRERALAYLVCANAVCLCASVVHAAFVMCACVRAGQVWWLCLQLAAAVRLGLCPCL